ncbi:hypothetical protein, partial [Pseudomonas aeruginosa]|uniref:hypothetical protein n=1 Tax=Pseudomonas aeruginosa TaxID=287 RepID=UPI00402B7241
AQALGLEDAVRSAYRGERCTYVLNSGQLKNQRRQLAQRTQIYFESSLAGGYTGRMALVATDPLKRVSIRCGGCLFFAKRQEYLPAN